MFGRTGFSAFIGILAFFLFIQPGRAETPARAPAKDELPQVLERIRYEFQHPRAAPTKPLPTQITNGIEWIRTIRPDGSFADQDYTNRDRVKWLCGDHLARLANMTVAYTTPGTAVTGNAAARSKILSGLKFWLDKDPQNENWWHADIGVPQFLGRIVVLLDKDCPADLRQRAADMMGHMKNWETSTGANVADLAMIHLTRACLINDADLARRAFDRMWKEIRVSGPGEDEGIQADWSFHQHGPLVLGDSYAMVFLNNAARFLRLADGTSYAPAPETYRTFIDFVLNSEMWMLRGDAWDFGVCGRSITRATEGDTHGFGSLLKELSEYSVADAQSLKALADSVSRSGNAEPLGNRAFWMSDYMAHRRANYFASVRMYSSRVWNTDGLTNGENKKSHHVADGATCLMITGKEYRGIYPTWDWHKIPGTTVEQDSPLVPEQVRRKSTADFVGSVSDGQIGCATMQLDVPPLKAKKSWFCFDGVIVCLGTDIQCPSDNPVMTTLNQCISRTPISSSAGPIARGQRLLKNTTWVWHDNIGYIFLSPTTAWVKSDSQTGAWSDIGVGSKDTVRNDVFTLALDHGKQVKDGQYAYVLMPGATAQVVAQCAKQSPVQIVSNSPTLQAVYSTRDGVIQAVFHQPGKLSAGKLEVTVDQPCLLMIRENSGQMKLTLSNPRNQPGTITVDLSAKLSGEGAEATATGSRVKIDLPDALHAGQSVTREFKVMP